MSINKIWEQHNSLRNRNPLMEISSRRRIFVSYHHALDQSYYDEFSKRYHDNYETIRDASLDREIDSDNSEYVMRRIRENYIQGTSCTIVLLGAEGSARKYLDWEIKASLDKENALIGIVLPTASLPYNTPIYPARFTDNLISKYAVLTHWHELTPTKLTELIDEARQKSKTLIDNTRTMMSRNN